MALVHNQYDRQNMFSKAGKVTSEKYIIFQKKDQILHHKKPQFFKETNQPNTLPDEFSPQIEIKKFDTHQDNNEQIQEQNLQSQKKQQQPFTKQLSREVNHYTKLTKDNNPSLVNSSRAIHYIPDFFKQQNLTNSKQIKQLQQEDQTKPIVERPRFHQSCFLDLKRQISRPNIFQQQPQPHPDRFNYLNVTNSWSKIPRTPIVLLNKQLSRDQLLIYKKKEFAPDYEPKYDFGKKNLGGSYIQFKKHEERKNIMIKIPAYIHETRYDEEIMKEKIRQQQKDKKDEQHQITVRSTILRNPTAPDFEKMLKREYNGDSLLPSYIQNTNTRIGITHIGEKMLKENNFSKGKFLTLTSSFMPSQSKNRKYNIEESSDEEINLND